MTRRYGAYLADGDGRNTDLHRNEPAGSTERCGLTIHCN